MKVLKTTALILVFMLVMMVPVFAESGNSSSETAEDRPLLEDHGEDGEGVEGNPGESRDLHEGAYRTELHQNTDEFLFSDEIQASLGEAGVKVIHTGSVDENTLQIGVYPGEDASRERVLNLLIQNGIGSEENFEIVPAKEVTILPTVVGEPAAQTDDAPDADVDPDTPVSTEEEAQAANDMAEEEYVRPDDENAEMGITSVEDIEESEGDGEESTNNYLFPILAVLGVAVIGGGIVYFKK